MTPTVCRLVGARAGALKRPIKWFSIAEFYRYERMQKGRGRSFFQFNADLFGEAGPEAEIELIALLVQCLRNFGLTAEDFLVRLSDRNLWFYYLESLGLGEERARSVLSAIDKFEKLGEEAFKADAEAHGPLGPGIQAKVIAFLGIKSLPELEAALGAQAEGGKLAARLADWRRLLDGLDAMGLSAFVRVDLGVVRGLAYYTGFVFEAFDRRGELRALAGGGRYDDLVAKLGGPPLPAAGFAIGDMTFALLLEQRGLMPALVQAADVYCVIGGAAERRAALGRHARAARPGPAGRLSLQGNGLWQAVQGGRRLGRAPGADLRQRGAGQRRRQVPRPGGPDRARRSGRRGDRRSRRNSCAAPDQAAAAGPDPPGRRRPGSSAGSRVSSTVLAAQAARTSASGPNSWISCRQAPQGRVGRARWGCTPPPPRGAARRPRRPRRSPRARRRCKARRRRSRRWRR